MVKVYWDSIKNIWVANSSTNDLDTNDTLFWFVLNNNYSFNECLLNKDYEYTFDFYDNKEIVLTSAISTKNEIYLTGLHLHMTSVSIGLE